MRYQNQDLLNTGSQMIGIPGFGGRTIKQYQSILLEILLEIDRICQKNGITYFLMYGTLIGAVRHHGFIPWDDDADLILTRDNYNRLEDACKSELSSEYEFISFKEDNDSQYVYSKIRKKETSYVVRSEISRHGHNVGFYIDIMALDYISDNPIHAFVQKRSLLAVHRLVSPGFCQGIEHLSAIEDVILKFIKLLAGRKRAIHFMEMILTSAKEKKSSRVVSNVLLKTRTEMQLFDKSHFQKSQYVPFENIKLPIPYNAISLLNSCYCKGNIANHSLLEYQYENEHEAILKGDYHKHNDIMLIVRERTRDAGRHMEIVFDSDKGGAYYDSYYFTRFDKRKNDRCAIRERHYKEKAAKYLKVMDENEKIAKLCCQELMLREMLDELEEKGQDVDTIPLTELQKICDELLNLSVIYQPYLSEKEFVICIKSFLRCGYLTEMCRLMQRIKFFYPEDVLGEQEKLQKLQDEHLEAYYAIFEKNRPLLLAFTEKYQETEYLLASLIKSILAFWDKDYETAEGGFLKILSIEENFFLAHYYLGLLFWERDKNREKAIECFKNSLDTSLYMPLLQMALDRIAEIEKAEDVKVDRG